MWHEYLDVGTFLWIFFDIWCNSLRFLLPCFVFNGTFLILHLRTVFTVILSFHAQLFRNDRRPLLLTYWLTHGINLIEIFVEFCSHSRIFIHVQCPSGTSLVTNRWSFLDRIEHLIEAMAGICRVFFNRSPRRRERGLDSGVASPWRSPWRMTWFVWRHHRRAYHGALRWWTGWRQSFLPGVWTEGQDGLHG